MAATFVVEDGSGVPGANAYIDLAYADQYHDNFGAPVAWTSLSDDDKKRHIREGTQYLDAQHGRNLQGYRTFAAQDLEFPRIGIIDDAGRVFDSRAIPERWKQACAVASFESVLRELKPTKTTPGAVSKITKKFGPMEKTIEYVGGQADEPTYPLIESLVAEFVFPGSRIILG